MREGFPQITSKNICRMNTEFGVIYTFNKSTRSSEFQNNILKFPELYEIKSSFYGFTIFFLKFKKQLWRKHQILHQGYIQ